MRALLSFLLLLPSPAASVPFAKVLSVTGLVSVEPSHETLLAGRTLSEGARITVMSDGLLRLKLESGEVLEVGPNSEISFHLRGKAPFVELPHGSLLAVAAAPTPLEVHSGEFRLHTRARAFFFEQRADQRAYVCACDGSVKARWGRSEADVSGKLHHHGTFLSATSRKPEVGPPSPLHHNDAHLKELRALL